MPLHFSSSPPSIFPTYLIPSIPFRRRSSTSTTSTSYSSSPSTPVPTDYLDPQTPSYLRCTRCLTDLCPTTHIISKGFTGRHGRAFLVSTGSSAYHATSKRDIGNLPNTHTHKPVPRQLVTGQHTVSDISCSQCGSVLGWKYVDAQEDSQKYKIGKFILETRRVVKGVDWESGESDDAGVGGKRKKILVEGDEDVEFDSQDEDECEDLFAGIWSPQLARSRRKRKDFLKRKEDVGDMV